MPIPRYYVADDLTPGGAGRLGDDQARHARSVLRLRAGAPIVLFNGTGVEATATLTALGQDATYDVATVARPEREPPLRLTVGLALLRGDHFELAVQKLTELGVARIAPLAAERSVVSFDVSASWEKRAARYARIAREAAEQSERVTLPEIAPPLGVDAFLERQPVTALVERAAGRPLAALRFETAAALAVGPEGGWSERESRAIERAAAGAASLGGLIYRAETAAIVAAGVAIQQAWANATRGEQQSSWASNAS